MAELEFYAEKTGYSDFSESSEEKKVGCPLASACHPPPSSFVVAMPPLEYPCWLNKEGRKEGRLRKEERKVKEG